ncbi:hypothetical protein, partial [Bacillus velezensis]|uniref:hypothetical protein n=1 Tax=Bacillus velezensis TaxID=492670 RepID=UPI001E51157F
KTPFQVAFVYFKTHTYQHSTHLSATKIKMTSICIDKKEQVQNHQKKTPFLLFLFYKLIP